MSTPDIFLDTVRDKGPINVFMVLDGVEIPITNSKIVANTLQSYTRAVLSVSLVSQNTTNNVPPPTIKREHVNNFYKFIGDDFGYSPSKYREVKNMPLWRDVYGVAPSGYWKIDRRTHATSVTNVDAAACRNCELLLPLRILTIDHQKPQSGGEMLALLRVFRGLGLTMGGPRLGGKNRDSLNRHANLVGGNSAITPGTPKSDALKSTNLLGSIYYSVFKHLGEIDWLKERCMHHYLNLRPLCGPCNSSLSNKNIW